MRNSDDAKSPTVRLQICWPAATRARTSAAILRISEPTSDDATREARAPRVVGVVVCTAEGSTRWLAMVVTYDVANDFARWTDGPPLPPRDPPPHIRCPCNPGANSSARLA